MTPPKLPDQINPTRRFKPADRSASETQYRQLLALTLKDDHAELSLALANGVNPNVRFKRERSLLSRASARPEGRDPRCALALIAAGALPTGIDADRESHCEPLRVACQSGAAQIAQALIQAGAYADLNPGSPDAGELLISCLRHPACVAVLISAGADVNQAGHRRETPLMAACSLGGHHPNSPALASASLLIAAGADLGLKNAYGLTAFDISINARLPSATQLLSNALAARAAAIERDALFESLHAPLPTFTKPRL